MAWPTTTIVTTDMDAASDDPSAARAEIKSMADNTNSVKDFPPLGTGINVQSGAYTIVAGDNGQTIVGTHATAQTITLLAAATAGDEFKLAIHAGGTGDVTISGTIGGVASIILKPGETEYITCNGSVYEGFFCPAYKAEVSGYTKGRVIQIDADPGVDTTQLSVSGTVTVATWESVGPTGSGATNIWTAMDSIPNDAKHVILKTEIVITGNTNNSTYTTYFFGRPAGSASAAGNITRRAQAQVTNRSGSSEADANMVLVFIPLDNNKIMELRWEEYGTSPTTTIIAYLTGWVE